ncbi:hypothetical protein EV401DRAFT_1889897 [Pisolithus croceorrhizus]|nr:hypothetical protein EV401DRAFT_1889897 [Pisolithus croceorrhizus]
MSSPPILNPDVYLNYLLPSVASEYELNRNMNLATLGALIWDILSSIPSDYRLIRAGKPSVVSFAYIMTRPASVVMVLLAVLLLTASYLFLKRVHAVYFANEVVQHTFSFLWLVGVDCRYQALQSGIRVGLHCPVAFMDPVLFDTLVYFAITYKILVTHTRGGGWKALCSGSALPHFSRASSARWAAVLPDNDRLSPSASPTLQVILSSPAVSLASVMASKVHRNLIIESMDNSGGSRSGAENAWNFGYPSSGYIASEETKPSVTRWRI